MRQRPVILSLHALIRRLLKMLFHWRPSPAARHLAPLFSYRCRRHLEIDRKRPL
jgi:hypothetical protein